MLFSAKEKEEMTSSYEQKMKQYEEMLASFF